MGNAGTRLRKLRVGVAGASQRLLRTDDSERGHPTGIANTSAVEIKLPSSMSTKCPLISKLLTHSDMLLFFPSFLAPAPVFIPLSLPCSSSPQHAVPYPPKIIANLVFILRRRPRTTPRCCTRLENLLLLYRTTYRCLGTHSSSCYNGLAVQTAQVIPYCNTLTHP